MNGPSGVATAARVDITTSDNVTFEEAYQFDPPGMTGCPSPPYWPCGATGPTWGFTGQNFRMDIKANRGATGPLMSLVGPTGGSQMVQIQDFTNRIMNFNVPESVLTGAATGATGATGPGMVPGEYPYDLIMFDGSNPPIRVMLMEGKFTLKHGISGG